MAYPAGVADDLTQETYLRALRSLPRLSGRSSARTWLLYDNVAGSDFQGAQAFNLGGRSVFWGGLIPRMGAWELQGWPAAVRDDLLTTGHRMAEDALDRNGPIGSTYQGTSGRS